MSFARAPVIRFNETKGSAPSPTRYNVHQYNETKATASWTTKGKRMCPSRVPTKTLGTALKKKMIQRTKSTHDLLQTVNKLRRSTSTYELDVGMLPSQETLPRATSQTTINSTINVCLLLAAMSSKIPSTISCNHMNCKCGCHGSEVLVSNFSLTKF